MKTRIHVYSFDTSKPEEKKAWQEFKAARKAEGLSVFKSHGGGQSHHHFVEHLDGQEIELETDFLFSNQWNTAPVNGSESGLRVFDWAQDYMLQPRAHIFKQGHYLEQTDEMRAIRANTFVCGYCAEKQSGPNVGLEFCDKCLGSEYLKSTELHMLRMRPVALFMPERQPLTEEERAYLLPLYNESQLHGKGERSNHYFTTTRAKVEHDFQEATAKARTECDGKLWLLDRRISIENVIFYSHTGRFSFGWRSPVDDEFKSTLLDAISEFHFPYEIKCADGKTLQGNIE